MGAWRGTTLGDIVQALTRYRPFVAVLVGIFLLATVLPGSRSLRSEGPGFGDTGEAPVTGPVRQGPLPQGDFRADTNSAGDALPAVTEPGRAAGGALPGSPVPAAPALAVGDPLEAPDCDPATGRIRVPSSSILYAPNCVAVWAKGADNGGATHLGVTKDTITVAIYVPPENAAAGAILGAAGVSDNTSEEEDDENRQKVVEAYEAHLETYGRKVKWVKVKASGPANDDAAAKADAIKVATEVKAFASLGDPSLAGGGNAYIEELVARGVMCVQCTPTQPHWNFVPWDPYVWNDRISGSGLLSHVAESLGKRLGQGPAAWAGDPLFQQRTRAFGLIQYNTVDGAYDGVDTHLESELARFKLRLTTKIEYMLDLSRSQEDARIVMARMKDAGATSIICWCDPLTPIFFTKEATNQQYFPEWIVTGSSGTDTTLFARLYDQLQWTHAFGVSLLTARVNQEVADREPNLVTWHYEEELTSQPNRVAFGMLFTGIHLAGSSLAPQTFKEGMASLLPAGGYLTRPGVSYGLTAWPWFDFHAIDDTTELWWDADSQGEDELGAEAQGVYRYVDGGRRYLLGQRAGPAKFFDEAGTSTVYDQRPQQDQLPQYEHGSHVRGT